LPLGSGKRSGCPFLSVLSIAEDAAKRLYYLSLDVSREQKKLPPIVPADFARGESWLSAGCVVFDVLIANGDRNATNLSRDPAFTPPRVAVFDHGHALLGTNPPTGLDRLALARGHLGCNDDSARIASDHILLTEPLNSGFLDAWVGRVEQLPEYVFRDVCRVVARTRGLNVDGDTAEQVAVWLTERAAALGDLIEQNQDAFPAVQWGLWRPGGQQ
jgi:hypothetical protein